MGCGAGAFLNWGLCMIRHLLPPVSEVGKVKTIPTPKPHTDSNNWIPSFL